MRNFILITALSLFAVGVQAETKQVNLFKCVDLENYQVNSQCTASIIDASDSFKAMEQQMSLKMEQQAPNVLATTQFFPHKMLIKVIAQKQREEDSELLVAALN
ncbi:MAG: hypothetical protein GW763_06540 [Paraglaciecola sp.]|nr:hypothetical protein [Paraglaciecola sp.]NCT47642.1 hypothetical protein [Paraglaciecola sp.]